MAAHLRRPPLSVGMETVVQAALSRGYTAQGEMFSGNLQGMKCGNHQGKSRAFLSLRFCFFTQRADIIKNKQYYYNNVIIPDYKFLFSNHRVSL